MRIHSKKFPIRLFIVLLSFIPQMLSAQEVNGRRDENAYFPIVGDSSAASIFYDASEDPLVRRAAQLLADDIEKVTGKKPPVTTSTQLKGNVIIIGTLGRNPHIDRLVAQNEINVEAIRGKWEGFTIQEATGVLPEIEKALVIAGSDRRGTAYGALTVSEKIGVSPWHWWADVPVKKQERLYFPTSTITDAPAVKYRGIFINDEAPALSGWAHEKFGGLNHKFYEKVYELILRLKGNMLWPAMWGRAIYDDDSLSAPLAHEMGIVIGTSHHEPMMRAHVEWERYGTGEWNYEKNETVLREFWRRGIERMGNNESIVTLGMRGDGDMAMSKETNVALLERIVHDQRAILADVTSKDIISIPQMWALYKEVQDYYDEGMRAPDDVTLLLCDDNWGNLRKLPPLNDALRKGGYGIYYHFDYVGGPRNYKWINTNQIERIWEQMNLAWQYNADRIWIVNVGDIKPMEFPTSFFLDMAWNPTRWNADNLHQYAAVWAASQFGLEWGHKIGRLLSGYTQLNARRKPELLSPKTYSLVNYREAERVVEEFASLLRDAENIYNTIDHAYRDAFFQLVLHPIKAGYIINRLYHSVALNHWYAIQGRSLTNAMAAEAESLFVQDSLLSSFYNDSLVHGKWNHMMDQTHIGYTYWQQPPINAMPETKSIVLTTNPSFGVSLEGQYDAILPGSHRTSTLPEFDAINQQQYFFEIFNRSSGPLEYSIAPSTSWIRLSQTKGTLDHQARIDIAIDWSSVPKGRQSAPVTVFVNSDSVKFQIVVNNDTPKKPRGFIENNGVIAIEAAHYSKSIHSERTNWKTIQGLGRTLSGVTFFPVTSSFDSPGRKTPHLQYDIFVFEPGALTIKAFLSPTLDFHKKGLRYAIAIDDEPPMMVDIHKNYPNKQWEKWVANNVNIQTTTHRIARRGKHTLKFFAVDPGVVLQRLVVERKPAKESYLGPPESKLKVKRK